MIMIKLLIFTGLRNAELARLRLQDVDLDQCQLRVVQGKGGKCVATHLPPYVAFTFMWRRIRRPRPEKAKPRRSAT
jgi:integrase